MLCVRTLAPESGGLNHVEHHGRDSSPRPPRTLEAAGLREQAISALVDSKSVGECVILTYDAKGD